MTYQLEGEIEAFKKKILFVGAFNTDIGAIGGQLFACTSLINSELKDYYDWILIDTTLEVPAPPMYVRVWRAIVRALKFLLYVTFKNPTTVLIFTGDGLSFIEKGTMTIIAKWLGKKTILAPRSGMLLDNLQNPTFTKFITFVIKRTDVVICQGESWKKTFNDIVSSNEKYHIIHNWIDVKNYEKSIKKESYLNQPVEILFLGWLETFKGIYELIEAVQKIKEKGLLFHLTIGGNGTQIGHLKKIVQEKNLESFVTIAGWLKGIHKFDALQKADIFVLPSHAEGFPNALLEAMCSGKACVATNVGAVADVLDENTGFIIPVRNSNALEKKLTILIENTSLRLTFSNNALKKASEQHSIKYAVARFKAIL